MIDLPRIGFGCWAIGGHGYGHVADAESEAAVRAAWTSGVRLFDTANVYGFGHSEAVLARALGRHRNEAIIATKGGVCWEDNGRVWKDCSAAALRSALEGSLRRLGIDCIPLYQLHWHDGKTPMGEIRQTLGEFQAEGKVRWIGCSNLDAELLGCHDAPRFDTIQLPYSLVRQESKGLMQSARRKGIRTIVYDVLARGLLTGKFAGTVGWPDNDTRKTDPGFQGDKLVRGLAAGARIRSVARRLGRDPGAVAVRWALQQDVVDCVVVGCKNVQQVEVNFAALDWCLDEADIRALSNEAGCPA